MTRKSKKEIEQRLDDLTDEQQEPSLRQPLTDEERAALDDSIDVEAWDATPQRRAILRSLMAVSQEGEQ